MKVFLSWSGDRSRQVAAALREWIPLVLQHVEPWMSDHDIGAGDRWAVEIGKRLEENHFGIICLERLPSRLIVERTCVVWPVVICPRGRRLDA